MKLLAFRVTNFRSVKDSGWIDTDDVTALIGTNESGKTNLLLPLWKLNPANEGEIKLLADAPRKDYNALRQMSDKPVFVEARFGLPDHLAKEIAEKAGVPIAKVGVVEVGRDFDGDYVVAFPNAQPIASTEAGEVALALAAAMSEIEGLTPSSKADEALKAELVSRLAQARDMLQSIGPALDLDHVKALQGIVSNAAIASPSPRSTVAPRFAQATEAIDAVMRRMTAPGPEDNDDVHALVIEHLPSFVYYSTYGNLDSEIYLPHVIADLKREDLTGRAEARARTLRVLFEFVRLKPEEILELGKDWSEAQGKPTTEQIGQLNEKKKERSVLLQSAGTELTRRFREWWKQGEYRLRFEADGNHFRIWVSDDRRPEEIELEGRSTGLQWFLSFYLTFLVESRAAHNGSILLLDEPGHSLHPIAQRDLSTFFESLAQQNQLIYTTHSPFLVDADHLDRVRNVYVDGEGYTAVSTDLRAGQAAAQSRSAYPVHAALGLSVSETLFQGCRPVIVEGTSDQFYLSAMKTLLVRSGELSPAREFLFIPGSGVKAIKAIASILGGKDGDLPLVLVDGDAAGRGLADSLRRSLYENSKARIVLLSEFADTPDAEIEDLLPRSVLVPIIDRLLKGPTEHPFVATGAPRPLVPQVEAYAKTHGLTLAAGWKHELARLAQGRLTGADPALDWAPAIAHWKQLFQRLESEGGA